MINESDLDSILDSLRQDGENAWSERTIKRALHVKKECELNMAAIDRQVGTWNIHNSRITTTCAVLSTFGSTATIVESIRQLLQEGSLGFTIVMIFVAIVDLAQAVLLNYQRAQDYEDKVAIATRCRRMYQYMANEVDAQIYRRTRYRANEEHFMTYMAVMRQAVAEQLYQLDLSDKKLTPEELEEPIVYSRRGTYDDNAQFDTASYSDTL